MNMISTDDTFNLIDFESSYYCYYYSAVTMKAHIWYYVGVGVGI